MALSCHILTVLLLACDAIAGAEADMEYGGLPLWVDRLAGEPSVMSLHGRLGPAWIRANNRQGCPRRCVCPVHWPTAVYCDHGNLTDAPNDLPDRTQYLFLQVGISWSLVDFLMDIKVNSPPPPFFTAQQHFVPVLVSNQHNRSALAHPGPQSAAER